jgi:hypothetical protein
MNDDACALFAGLSASVGTSGTDCRVSDVNDGLYNLARRGVKGTVVGVFDNVAIEDFQTALEAASSNMAVYAGAADRLMGVSSGADQGRTADGYTLSYKGASSTARASRTPRTRQLTSCRRSSFAVTSRLSAAWRRSVRLRAVRSRSPRRTRLRRARLNWCSTRSLGLRRDQRSDGRQGRY